MKKKMKPFLGHPVTKGQHNKLVSLINMTTYRFGVSKKQFKSEDVFWNCIEFVTGERRKPLEDFHAAISRIHAQWSAGGLQSRNEKVYGKDRGEFLKLMPNIPTHTVTTHEEIVRNAKKAGQKIGHMGSSQPSVAAKKDFYSTWEWRTLRMKAIQKHGRACQCCGAKPGDVDVSGKPVRIVVDHIKPISKHWGMRLELSNLQILCDECNMGKGNWDETDFRDGPKPPPPQPLTEFDVRMRLIMEQLGTEVMQ